MGPQTQSVSNAGVGGFLGSSVLKGGGLQLFQALPSQPEKHVLSAVEGGGLGCGFPHPVPQEETPSVE